LYELPPNDRLSLDEGEDLNIHRVTEDSTLPLFGRDDELLVAQDNQPENEVRPPSPVHEYEVSPLFQHNDIDSLSTEDSIPLRDRGGIPQMVKPAQVLCSGGVSVEEYLDDIFKSKRRYSCALLYK